MPLEGPACQVRRTRQTPLQCSPLPWPSRGWPRQSRGRVRGVIPAKAGIQNVGGHVAWIPACAGTSLDSCLRRNDTSMRLKCYPSPRASDPLAATDSALGGTCLSGPEGTTSVPFHYFPLTRFGLRRCLRPNHPLPPGERGIYRARQACPSIRQKWYPSPRASDPPAATALAEAGDPAVPVRRCPESSPGGPVPAGSTRSIGRSRRSGTDPPGNPAGGDRWIDASVSYRSPGRPKRQEASLPNGTISEFEGLGHKVPVAIGLGSGRLRAAA